MITLILRDVRRRSNVHGCGPYERCNDEFALPAAVGRGMLNAEHALRNLLGGFARTSTSMQKEEETNGQLIDGGIRLVCPNVDLDAG